MEQKKEQRVALVHDFLVSYGGAERVLQSLVRMYPEAPIFTLLADPNIVNRYFPKSIVKTSFLSKFPRFLQKRYRLLLPFFPVAIETLDLREYDLVISSSGAWSKGIVTRLHTWHIAYLHSPLRYAWDKHAEYLDEIQPYGRMRFFARLLLSYLRLWDRAAAERPDILLANSEFTRRRIEKYYRREAKVVYPGATGLARSVSDQALLSKDKRKHFLVVSRLTESKSILPVVDAFSKLGLSLVVVGTGREEKRLREAASESIRFSGAVTDEELCELYRSARALLLPSEEDFGMVAVEALSFGTPIIALEYGGIHEIIEPGVTGEVFHSATREVIAEAVMRFLEKESSGYPIETLRESTNRFREEIFEAGIRDAVRQCKE